MSRSKQELAGHHLEEALRHLTTAVTFMRELPDRDADEADRMALVVEGAIETLRDVCGHVDGPAPPAGIRARASKQPDRRGGDRRAAKRRLDDKRKAALRSRGPAK